MAMSETHEHVMLESFLRWSLNGQVRPPFLCTPQDGEDLTAGYLLTSGLACSYEQIADIRAVGESLAVRLRGEPGAYLHLDRRLAGFAPIAGGLLIPLATLVEHARKLTGEEQFFGTHRIMLCGPEGEIVREDIGRHNAADKVIGAAARMGWDFSLCAMGATGRVSLEILAKAAAVGIPVIFSKKYPSDLCAEWAHCLRIGIAGKILGAEPEVFGAVWRIDMQHGASMPHG